MLCKQVFEVSGGVVFELCIEHLIERGKSSSTLVGFLWVLRFPPTGKVDRVG